MLSVKSLSMDFGNNPLNLVKGVTSFREQSMMGKNRGQVDEASR